MMKMNLEIVLKILKFLRKIVIDFWKKVLLKAFEIVRCFIMKKSTCRFKFQKDLKAPESESAINTMAIETNENTAEDNESEDDSLKNASSFPTGIKFENNSENESASSSSSNAFHVFNASDVSSPNASDVSSEFTVSETWNAIPNVSLPQAGKSCSTEIVFQQHVSLSGHLLSPVTSPSSSSPSSSSSVLSNVDMNENFEPTAINETVEEDKKMEMDMSRMDSAAHSSSILHNVEKNVSLRTEVSSESSSFENGVINQQPPCIIRSGGNANQGNRSYMEDVHVIFDNLHLNDFRISKRIPPSSFYGVFDGHGGSHAAHFASKHLVQCFLDAPSFPDCLSDAMKFAFQRTDNSLHDFFLSGEETYDSGTTALAVFVCGSKVVVANAGDCRAVLSRRGKAIELSEDHKPQNKKEKERIYAAGGFVQDEYVNELLGVSRTLGDWHMGLKDSKNPILVSEPEVRETTLTEEDEFIVIACDGLWDVISSKEAIVYARRELQTHNDPRLCSEALVKLALSRHSTDNLTVLTVCFGPNRPPPVLHGPWRPSRRISRS